jgi:hypothetical protein
MGVGGGRVLFLTDWACDLFGRVTVDSVEANNKLGLPGNKAFDSAGYFLIESSSRGRLSYFEMILSLTVP